MRLQPRGMKRPSLCNHVFDAPTRHTHLHSTVECKLCGYEKVVPTPEHLKPEPDWRNAREEI